MWSNQFYPALVFLLPQTFTKEINTFFDNSRTDDICLKESHPWNEKAVPNDDPEDETDADTIRGWMTDRSFCNRFEDMGLSIKDPIDDSEMAP